MARTPVYNCIKCGQPTWAPYVCRQCSPATVGQPVPKMAPESYINQFRSHQS